jgi:hypothetical protein
MRALRLEALHLMKAKCLLLLRYTISCFYTPDKYVLLLRNIVLIPFPDTISDCWLVNDKINWKFADQFKNVAFSFDLTDHELVKNKQLPGEAALQDGEY